LSIKGIQNVDDAKKAARLGVDAIILSNHGGRQLDQAPRPLELIASCRKAVGRARNQSGTCWISGRDWQTKSDRNYLGH
ncbi:MAG: alpha-hydroxy-acid oxidizing protein, partial [Candidatus Nanopelagicaceae bacterium]